MSRIPSEGECVRILEEEGCSPLVIRHCCRVMTGAVAVAMSCGADRALVVAGALLHDVGRSRDQGIGHLKEGIMIARRRKLPIEVVNIIQRHVGAGLDDVEARDLSLPPGGYMPVTLEEKIVAQCDNLIEEEVRSLGEVMREFIKRGYPKGAERAEAIHHQISERLGEDLTTFLHGIDMNPVRGPCSAYTSRR